MCTALLYCPSGCYFGRNLDVDRNYGEEIVITPRNFPFNFRKTDGIYNHPAIIGSGIVMDGFPLYFDAVNEYGLGIAGLNFPQNACYLPTCDTKKNISPFEFIPYILSKCCNTDEAEKLISDINLVNIPFSKVLPLSPLHWQISDSQHSIVIEPGQDGVKKYENPTGVLTNEPPFPFQLHNLNNYMHISAHTPKNRFSEKLALNAYSFGMGGLGLPGDLSSASRFIKAVFTKENSLCSRNKNSEISQFFHILSSVSQQRGCVCTISDHFEFTEYSSCCDLEKIIYYYKSYENSGITAVNLFKENLEHTGLITYPLLKQNDIKFQN